MSKKECCVVKIDMKKAYDRVDWKFLEKLIKRMGFSGRWVLWIMCCIRSVSYRLVLNGKKTEGFRLQRGLRERDPLSPTCSFLPLKYSTDSNMLKLKNILWIYYAAIGQAVNYQKFSILFSDNIAEGTKTQVGEILRLQTNI